MNRLLRAKQQLWAVLFLFVTLAGGIAYVFGARHLAAQRAVEQALAVEATIDGTLSLYKDAETGQRGFVLTGLDEFLEPYDAARASLPGRLRELHPMLDGDPLQRQSLAELERLARQKIASIEETIRIRRGSGGLEAALARTRFGQGKAIMDAMRAVTRQMLDREVEVTQARRREANVAKQAATAAVASGILATVAMTLFALFTAHRDVEELRRAAERLAESEEHFRLLAENTNDLLRLLDLSGKTTYVSPSVERLLGFTPDEFMALSGRALLHPDDVPLALSILDDVTSGKATAGVSTYKLRNKAGEYRLFEVRWSVLKDASGEVSIHTAGRDVTERQRNEELLSAQADQLRDLSLRDELTQLYNRRGFLEIAGQAHAQARSDGRTASLVFLDLNGMKKINDQHGHDAGDDALKDTARVLVTAFGAADVVARLGGDEFVAFSVGFSSEDLAPLRARLRELADRETSRQERPYRLSMSVGAAFADPTSKRSLADLLEGADAAMYEQKRARQAAGNVSIPPPRGPSA